MQYRRENHPRQVADVGALLLHGSRLRSVPRPQVYGMAGLGRSGVDGQGRAPGACTKDYYFHSTMRR